MPRNQRGGTANTACSADAQAEKSGWAGGGGGGKQEEMDKERQTISPGLKRLPAIGRRRQLVRKVERQLHAASEVVVAGEAVAGEALRATQKQEDCYRQCSSSGCVAPGQ